MTVGNLVALRQSDAVRLLAWSTVAQAGWVVLPLAGAVRRRPAARPAATCSPTSPPPWSPSRWSPSLARQHAAAGGAPARAYGSRPRGCAPHPVLACGAGARPAVPRRPAARGRRAGRQGRGAAPGRRRRALAARPGRRGQRGARIAVYLRWFAAARRGPARPAAGRREPRRVPHAGRQGRAQSGRPARPAVACVRRLAAAVAGWSCSACSAELTASRPGNLLAGRAGVDAGTDRRTPHDVVEPDMHKHHNGLKTAALFGGMSALLLVLGGRHRLGGRFLWSSRCSASA